MDSLTITFAITCSSVVENVPLDVNPLELVKSPLINDPNENGAQDEYVIQLPSFSKV